MSPAEIREVLAELAGPTYAGDFTDLLMLLAAAADEAEEPAMRAVYEQQADAALRVLAADLAAEFAAREAVAA